MAHRRMKIEDSTVYTDPCFNGELASCSYACPFFLDVRSFLDKISRGRWNGAYKTFRNSVVFPAVVSELCPQPCRKHCQREMLGDEPLALKELEKATLRYASKRKPESYSIPPKKQGAAIIGAGPAGLSAALSLAQKKYSVTVYEKEKEWGGHLKQHPRYKQFDEDFSLQFSTVTVDFRFETEVTDIRQCDDYDVIYLATGEKGESFGLLKSWQRDLLTTSVPRIFMGGSLCGSDVMDAIAQGAEVSKTIEVFLQTGKSSMTHGMHDREKRDRYIKHDDEISRKMIVPSNPEGYSEEEAQLEASRCMQCDCTRCMEHCEMLEWFRKKPHKIGIDVYTDSNANPPISGCNITRETYSCNICGHCESVCPVDVNFGDLLQYSRTDRKNSGKHPAALNDFWLREMDFNTTEGFYSSPQENNGKKEYLFFPGCQLGAVEPEYVLRSYEYLQMKKSTGILVNCCGAPAYWGGDQKRLDDNVKRIREVWEDAGKPVMVTACATCETMFARFMKDIECVSLYQLLAEDDSVNAASFFERATVFDPCASRHDEAMEEGVRSLVRKSGAELEEVEEPNRCCGYGGHMKVANPALYDLIVEHRTGAKSSPYIVYCVNCQEVFESSGKECVHILDMVFNLPRDKKLPSIQEKRENSLKIKRVLMKNETGKEFVPEKKEWDDIDLIVSEDVQEEMERKLISLGEVKEAVWQAEKSGDKFINEEDGIILCSMIKKVLTYWVEYREKSSGTYEILSVYSHRIRFKREA